MRQHKSTSAAMHSDANAGPDSAHWHQYQPFGSTALVKLMEMLRSWKSLRSPSPRGEKGEPRTQRPRVQVDVRETGAAGANGASWYLMLCVTVAFSTQMQPRCESLAQLLHDSNTSGRHSHVSRAKV